MPITPLNEVMCSCGDRVKFDLKDWYSHSTRNIDELRKKIDEMHLVGRTISDIRFVSHCYNMLIDDIEETVWLSLTGYPRELQQKLSEFDNIDDYFPFPLYLEMDEPLLLRFEDGDCFEVATPAEGSFNVSLNSIPWNVDWYVNPENINGSIMFDCCKGAKIESAEVLTDFDFDKEYIQGVKLSWRSGQELVSLHIEGTMGDYQAVFIERWDQLLHVPFLTVKRSMYKGYYKDLLSKNDTCEESVKSNKREDPEKAKVAFSPELEQMLQEMKSPIFRGQAERMREKYGCTDEAIIEFLDSIP